MESLARKLPPQNSLPPFIKQRMIELGLFPSISFLSREMAMPAVTIGKYMRGQRSIPIPVLLNLSEILCTSLDELVRKVPEFLN